jgi:hypothetical protein
VTLLITLVLITLVLFALFLGGGLVAQGYLYQEPADRLPLRALAGAVLVSSFVALWVMIDARAPGKYDTFFRFSPYQTKEFTEFEAVRWVAPDGVNLKKDEGGNKAEVLVKFKKGTGSRSNTFVEAATGEPFQLNSSGKSGESYMTGAILARPGPEAEPVRFDATTREQGSRVNYVTGPEGRQFKEKGGSRYVQADQLGVVYEPSTGAIVLALLINLLHFVVWFAAFWPILQFTRGHAFILATVFALVTMLVVMPLLFERNRAKPGGAAEPPRTAWLQGSEVRGQRAEGRGQRAEWVT